MYTLEDVINYAKEIGLKGRFMEIATERYKDLDIAKECEHIKIDIIALKSEQDLYIEELKVMKRTLGRMRKQRKEILDKRKKD